MKKIIILLTLVISFTLVIGGTALAATEGDYYYDLINNGTEVEITGYIPTDPNVVVIPEMIVGKPVTSIGTNVFRSKSITSVAIPYGVTSIGEYAFYDCNSLTSVTIPNSVTSIGNHAFQTGVGLANLVIPDSVVSIGTDAFANNNTLNSITLSDSITSFGSGGFWACNYLYYAYYMADGAANGYTYGTGTTTTTEVIKDYKVVFDGAGGYGFDALQLVNATDNVTAPSQTTKINCTFNGWFDDETGGNKITFPTTVSQNTTYYAQWTGENYTVTLNDGTNTSTVTAMYGSAMPNGGAVPTTTGYTFDGYYSEENGEGRQYYDANMASSNYWNIGSDTTLYAKWIASTYTVTLNDGNITSAVTATYGSVLPSGVTVPTKTGYIFEGYYSAIDGGGTQYYNLLMHGITSWETEGGGTLYAKWTADTYTITLNDGTSVASTVTATYDSEMPDGGAVPTKTDYVFDGYYTEIDGAGIQYYTGTMASSRNWDVADNTVLFAKWNSIPTRLSTVPATTTASIIVGNAYNLDLSTIFEDEDSNPLNYMVSINSSSEIIANESYSYVATNLGMTNLVFRANNGTYDSIDIHFVQLTVTDPDTNELTGTVIISDDGTPQYNEIITANISTTNNTGTLIYQWKRGSINIGTDSNQYIITEDDIYENITVEITSSRETGSITSSNIIVPLKASYSSVITNPTEFSHSHNSVTLNIVDYYEYKEDNGNWQSSNAFTGLLPDTAYTFIQRVAESNTHDASTTSSTITIITDSISADALTGNVAIIGNAVYGEELSASISGTNELGTLVYQWQADGMDINSAINNTYTLTENEIGKAISVEVRDTDNGSGVKTSYIESVETASVDKESPNTPNAPTKISSTTSNVTLTQVNGNEYRCNSGEWQDSNVFTALTASTNYNFTQRIKETTTAYTSAESSLVTFSTTGNYTSSGGSSTIVVVRNEYTTKIPSYYIGKDKVFKIESDKVKVSISGLSLSKYKGDNVEIFIQRINTDYFDLGDLGEFPEGMPVFDISLIVDGEKVPFESDIPLEIEFEIEGNYENHKMVAVYLADDGSYEILEGIYDGKVIKFTTNHLSNYVLIYVDKTFDDISGHWGKEAIEALAARGVVNGIGNNLFNPNGEITRAEFATIMVRYFDLTAYGTDLGYTDVENNSWYAEYVWVARENDILPEIYGDKFEPNKAITREEMMYTLYKSLEVTGGLDRFENGEDKLSDFTDSETIVDYAVIASKYLISKDIINGSGDMINPTSMATRAEVAQMVYNLLKR